MKKAVWLLLLLILPVLAACGGDTGEETFAVSNEPGVVTVFKNPT